MPTKLISICTLFASLLVVLFVLFVPPNPGVADQGDFQRVMDIAGLKETDEYLNNPSLRFFYYVKTKYIMTSANPFYLFGIIPSFSVLYPITIAKAVCKIASMEHFDTRVLAAVYSLLYISALFMCLAWIGCRNTPTLVFAAVMSVLVLMDGNYLIWFNSLYGEPMMITGLLLFSSSILYIAYTGKAQYKQLLFTAVASFLFVGSKTQCIACLPFVVAIIINSFFTKPNSLQPIPTNNILTNIKQPQKVITILLTFLLVSYSAGIYLLQNRTCGVDTKYNSVFYGILKSSDNPEKDLELLGLSKDLAVEKGKHAYLPQKEYAKYAPWTEITETEFNQKISNLKLVKFYLKNPKRFLKGMEYTASQSFQTGTSLGKYEKADISEYTYAFDRHTFWSDFRNRYLPKKLWFIVSFYSIILIVSIYEYIRHRDNSAYLLRIKLLWVIIAIGAFQFPMPYVGNGEADTAKQLFLFNYTFDILTIVACSWVFNRLFNLTVTMQRSSAY